MSNKKRTYQVLWEQLKDSTILTVQIKPKDMTDAQARESYRTLTRGVQKEKWLDIHFKDKYPRAVVSAELDLENRLCKFKLDYKQVQLEILI